MTPTEILTLHHLRKTPTRLAIVQYLQTSPLPQSENELHQKMQASYDRITVYRTIQTLMETGVIHRITVDSTTVRYALNHCTVQLHEHDNNHVHFYCTNCGKLECLKGVSIQPYQLPEGYRKEECHVVIKGLCKQCSIKSQTENA
ncbi:MAG: transcriptional repressor [Bacteroidota bacterium]|nr:transcriptional repressor [Bacteroidota bacterium]